MAESGINDSINVHDIVGGDGKRKVDCEGEAGDEDDDDGDNDKADCDDDVDGVGGNS